MAIKSSNPEEDVIAKIQLYNLVRSWAEKKEREIERMEQEGVSEEWIEKYKLILDATKSFVGRIINEP